MSRTAHKRRPHNFLIQDFWTGEWVSQKPLMWRSNYRAPRIRPYGRIARSYSEKYLKNQARRMGKEQIVEQLESTLPVMQRDFVFAPQDWDRRNWHFWKLAQTQTTNGQKPWKVYGEAHNVR